MAKLSLVVISVASYIPRLLDCSTSRARALSNLGAFFAATSQRFADSTSRARALNQLSVAIHTTQHTASSTSRARALSWLYAGVNETGLLARSTSRARALSVQGVLLVLVLALAPVSVITMQTQAATADHLNFQGRLLTNTGGLVPDGDYHIEFKLYDAASSSGSSQGSCAGDANCLWTETLSTGNLVTIRNGYYSVYLGEVTAFPSSIDWSQDLYLTMNIGGTAGSPSWDGEMNPRFQLTSVPYAFSAANVGSADTNAGTTDSNDVSITTGNALGATSNSGDIIIDTGTATGTAGVVSLGATNASALTIGNGSATTTLQGSVSITGVGTALTVTNDAAFNGDTTIGNESTDMLTVNAAATFTGDVTINTGDTFTNAGSSLFSAVAIADIASDTVIGTAAATVDVATTFDISQTSGGGARVLTLPTPTDTASGRIVYVNNVGSADFTLYGNTIETGSSGSFIWNGTNWVTTLSFSNTGADTIGALNGGTANINGATITGTTLFLQSASTSFAGVVDTTTQSFAGVKTFTDDVIIAADDSLILTGGTSLPGSPTEGEVFYDSSANVLYIYDGSSWDALNSPNEATAVVGTSTSLNGATADYLGDGTADNVEINNALDAVDAAGGGTVYLLEGVYDIDAALQIHDNTTLIGSGIGNTRLELDSGLSDAVVENASGATTGIEVRNLTIDGNDNAGTNQRGIHFSSVGSGEGATAITGFIIDSVQITDIDDQAVYLASANNGVITNSTFEDTTNSITGAVLMLSANRITFDSNAIVGSSHEALRISSVTDSTFTNNRFQGSVNTAGTAINVEGAGSQYNVFTNNVISDNAGNGITLRSSSSFTTLNGNTITANDSGIVIDTTTDNTITGNNISSNTVNGITAITSGADRNTITGNTISSNTADGINFTAADYNLISGNIIATNGGSAVEFGATSSNFNTINGNSIYNNGGSGGTDAIIINPGNDNRIIGNTISDTAGSGVAINISASSNRTYLADNTYSGTGAEAITDGSSTTVFAAQLTTDDVLRSDASEFISNRTITLTGSIDPTASTSVTGVSTLFNSELNVGDRITVTGETRTVVAIASDTSLTVDTAFSDNANDTSPDRLPAPLAVRDSSGNTDVVVTENGDIFINNLDCSANANGGTLTTNANGRLVCADDDDAGATLTLQGAYDNGTDGILQLDGTRNGIFIQDASSTVGDIFVIENEDGSTDYLTVTNTTTTVGGNLSVTGTATFNGDVTIAADDSLILTGGGTLPGSPTEGQVFYDSTNDELLIYNGSQWEQLNSTGTPTIVVAASDSLNPEIADYRADGTSDEDTINTALADLPAGGGVLYLMEGTFVVDGAITGLSQYDQLVGAGDGTVIQLAGALSADTNAITLSADNVTVRNLLIDGNKAAQSDTNALLAISVATGADYNTFDAVSIIDTEDEAISTDGSYGSFNNMTLTGIDVGGIVMTSNATNNSVTDSYFEDASNSGFAVQIQGADNIVSDIIVDGFSRGVSLESLRGSVNNSKFNDQGTYGVASVGGSSGVIANNSINSANTSGIVLSSSGNDNVVTDNTFVGNTVGINVQSARNIISNNQISTSTNSAIVLSNSGDYTLVTGNYLYDNGGSGASDSIEAQNGAIFSTITNNYIVDTAGTGYAINLSAAGVNGTYLSGNTYSGTGATEINDVGTNTVYAGQTDTTGDIRLQAATSDIIEILSNTDITGTVTVSDTATFNGNTVIGNEDADSLTVNANTIQFNGSSFANCTALTTTAGAVGCSTTTFASSLQTAYVGGNTIVATDAEGDIDLTVSEATNFTVDITGTGTFQVQDAGNDVLNIADGGAVVFQNTVDSTTGFQILDQDGGTAVLNVDTTNERVGIAANASNFSLSVGDLTAANGSTQTVIEAQVGSDGSLGPLSVQLGGQPSATGSSRFGYISASDNSDYRALALNTNDGSTFGRVGVGTVSPSGRLEVTGDYSGAAWGVNAPNFVAGAATYTNSSTAASGTAANAAINSFEAPTLAAVNTGVTTTLATNVYIQGGPIAGTNQTITESLAIWVDSGISRFDGDIQAISDVRISGDLTSNNSTMNVFNTTPTTLNIGGAATTVSLGASTGATTVNNGLTVTGESTINNELNIGSAITLSNDGNVGTSADIAISGPGLITTEDDFLISFDSNNDDTNRAFIIGNNAATGTPTALLTVRENGNVELENNTILGNANTNTVLFNAGTSGTGITFADSSFQDCVLSTSSAGVLTCLATGGASPGSLQNAYQLDTDGSDVRIDLTTADDSVIFSNPASGGTDSIFVAEFENNATGNTDDAFRVLEVDANGSFDTTAGDLTNYGALIFNSASESAGGNNLTNVGLYASASGADTNYAAIFELGSVGIGTATPLGQLQITGDEVRIGDGGTIDIATGDGDLYIEDAAEIDGALQVSGSALFQNSVDSTTSFQILDQDGGSPVVNVDTTNERLGIGTDAPDTTLDARGNVTVGDGFVGAGFGTDNIIQVTSDTDAERVGIELYVSEGSDNRRATFYVDDGLGETGFDNTCSSACTDFVFRQAGTIAFEVEATDLVRVGDGGTADVASATGDLYVQDQLEVDGSALFQNSTDSASAFVIRESAGAGGSALLEADTSNFLLKVSPTQFVSSGSTQVFAVDGSISGVDDFSTIAVNATGTSVDVTLPAPAAGGQVIGRVVYVTAVNGSEDFNLSLAGTGIDIAMKANSTATLIWNGTGWTAAGASSSTDLQSAYNNTLTSAGGAELVLNAPGGSADGLTVRNNDVTPITGGLLEIQTSIGSNLFGVNNNATEFASNGGAETVGATASTFPASTWSAPPTGGTVTRFTTAGDNVATGQASVQVVTTGTDDGAANQLASALTPNLEYTASFTVRGLTNFTTLEVVYSRDGTNTSTTACTSGQTVTSGQWSRITCTFTAPSSGITSANEIFIRQTDGTGRTFYIDNLSVNINAAATYVADGSVDDSGSFGTNWTAFDVGAGSSVVAEETGVIYDTSASARATLTGTGDLGIRNNLSIDPQTETQYLVSFFARTDTTITDNLAVGFLPAGGNSVPTGSAACTDYNTQSLTADVWTRITCLFTTTSTTISDPDLVIYKTDGTSRIIYVDALSVTLNTNNSNNVQIGGGNLGGPVTLFTLDRSAGNPIADNNEAYLGSMYYDTITGRIQCYEADGWGACGAAPDNVVNLNPEYAGAVLNGTGVGTMTADFCSNDAALSVNSTFCDAGQAKNFYNWTSPQATEQTYSIYVTYQLPETFNGFASDDTVQLVARADSTTNAAVTYEMFRSIATSGSEDVIACGSETTVVTTADTWQSVGINGNEATGCGLNASAAGDFIIFKINLKAQSNANAYVSTLSFVTTGR